MKRTTHSIDWTLTRNEDEVDVRLSFSYYPGSKQTYWHPGDPPETELLACCKLEGKKVGAEIQLTEAETEKAVDYINENFTVEDEEYDDDGPDPMDYKD